MTYVDADNLNAVRDTLPRSEINAYDEAEEREAENRGLSRRQLFSVAGMLGAAAVLGGSPAAASTAPRVVIVGAGLAGLRCAHRLWRRPTPIAATVYEADTTHIGGRCWSLRNYFAGGQVHEHGGSFISSGDTAILNLARGLGLKKEFANGGQLDTGDYLAWINGGLYTGLEQQEDWVSMAYDAFNASYTAAGYARYNHYNPEAYRLDQLSCLDYFDEIGLSADSRIAQLIQTLQLQGGGEPSEVSALNIIGFLGGSSVFGGGGEEERKKGSEEGGFDEKYHIIGGNDQVVTGMAAQLPAGSVKQGYELIALCRNSNGSYTCTFNHAGRIVSVPADHVVLALPFSMLRRVDLSRAQLSARKLTAIRRQGMGQNAKLVTQLTRKTWPARGGNGVTNTGPSGYQTAWDGSVQSGPNGSPALLVNFPGGNVARNTLTGAAHGPAPQADVQWFLAQVEQILPGTRAAYNGRAYEDHWSLDPWHYGAYHYYKPGQYTSFAGYEEIQEGRIHFAGEHTMGDVATLNSAVVSGERAATEITSQI
ncbi:flavin monoamine oxidase family protein [Embleya sp. NBC_00896]|uniref:flavin monoamine oxidase family protein n=1 Tax=Embleya sp. NBC_00896 TaxID=2975961 RepID=UPI003869F499|nr:FAD-dependent oxidoreductase [Embleya sp. NBC_00896]